MLQNSSSITAPIINGSESKRKLSQWTYVRILTLYQIMAIEIITKDFGNELNNKMEDASNYDELSNLTQSLSEAFNHSKVFGKGRKKLKRKDGHFRATKIAKKVDYYKRWNALLHGRDGEWMNAVIVYLTECSLNKEGSNTVIDARQCEKDCNWSIHEYTYYDQQYSIRKANVKIKVNSEDKRRLKKADDTWNSARVFKYCLQY
mmetsp:Transcript_9498/g.12313  ORF Transcript_9498/g.12313 Transcript_9498/m.12313 type:complete len:204 (-) Transcript_9498:58-669(-)